MVVPEGRLEIGYTTQTIKQGTLHSLSSISMDSPKEPSTAAPISIFHVVLLSLLPRAENKSTASNVRRKGWELTSSTATDPFAAMLLYHVCGEGKEQGRKKLLTEVLQILTPGILSFRDLLATQQIYSETK